MSDFDLLVRSAQDIGISEGKIIALGKSLSGSAKSEIDAHGLATFPGVIDAHVHFNQPGRTEWEGFDSGSRAAAAGGTTTVFEMPLNAQPPTIDGWSFDLKRASAETDSFVDFALWGGLVPGNIDQLETLRDRGVIGLKAFMCDSGMDDFPAVDEQELRAGMQRAAELGLIVAVHAESQEITQQLTQDRIAAGKTSVRDYLESRPVRAELEAIHQALDLAGETGCRLHIVHVSCGRGVEIIARSRARGVDVTCETCPHYLFLTEEDMKRLGAVAKCAPPLRAPDEQKDLLSHLHDVATIGSDHSPSPWSMKERTSFFEVWGGISSCQHLLSLLLDASISPTEIERLTSKTVAERFGLAQKGAIEIGKDADFTLVDLNDEDTVTTENLHYRHRHTPYLGRKLRGRVVRTVLRGQTIFHNGKITARSMGKFIRP
ncbi:MAG: allantoinase AllB [Verrucomicrobiota bacterium]